LFTWPPVQATILKKGFTLAPKHHYVPSDKSLCFPGIPLDEMTRILGRMNTESETALIRSFRDYVRREIVRDLPS
jgi:hypothetical protein